MQARKGSQTTKPVSTSEMGGRQPKSPSVRWLIMAVAIAWSLFQIYYASPLGYALQLWLHRLGIAEITTVIDDTRARAIHLAFALFLAYLYYPAFKRSSRDKVPIWDWIFAVLAVLGALYYVMFYTALTQRVSALIMQDIIVGCVGIVLLLEATRRSLGLPLVIIAVGFLFYNFVGQFFPLDWLVSHNSGSISQIVNQQWITTEGVFGVALGVSTNSVFLFVLFGALLDKAGAGNYFIKTAFAYLGHLKGGPAKAAVVSSGVTGMISGSSIANVVTTGTFTIPMMKRVGFSAEKSGAIEVASSVNGQIMPPVMGAAAFLMVEYVGIPYSQLIKNAFLPAMITYIALVYIVHLEACKQNLQGIARIHTPNPILVTLLRFALLVVVLCALSLGTYYLLGWIYYVAPKSAFLIVCGILLVAYLALLYRVSGFPDLEIDDPNIPVIKLPEVRPTINAGLHFLLPVIVLIWCLMVEEKSPSYSAYWGIMTLLFILLTQYPLLLFFRKRRSEHCNQYHDKRQYWTAIRRGFMEIVQGFESGARSMINIGIATATAGIIVGVVALTSVGPQLSNIIEILSMGNLVLMLIMVALFSLILGMGLPTTANYVVVSTLMATVIVEVGQKNGLIVPLVAVHLFVFYFGVMADVTPPVGLASFAASAISGGDPIKTGLTAFFYSLRTVLLPFFFIFNTDLLLINVSFLHSVMIFVVSVVAMFAFTSATMGWFLHKNRIWEGLLLLLITAVLFRPGFFMNYISPSTRTVAPEVLVQAVGEAPVGDNLKLHISGIDQYGDPITFYAVLPIRDGENGEARLKNIGITLKHINANTAQAEQSKWVIDDVQQDSIAAKAKLDWDQVILDATLPASDNWSKYWMYLPGLGLFALIAWIQYKRRERIIAAKG